MSRIRVNPLPFLGMFALGLLLAPTVPAHAAQDQEKPAKKVVYDEQADAAKDLEVALAKARKDHQRVLVVFGANW